ncbi:hypothetical protein ACV3R5_15425 [Clostridium perfringens]|uniref:hypothetical protein n=1 Tax=Clostridium perfringens TaxID=1502 RepID=UPI0039EA032A
MKKIFKIIGIGIIGLPILNLFAVSITKSILLIFTKNIEIVKNNIYPIVLIDDIITLLLIALIFLPRDYGIKDIINKKKYR